MKKIELIVKKYKQETDDTKTIFFSIKNKKKINFKAGQFLNIFFCNKESGNGKAYTISSSMSEKLLAITVQNIGDFSNKLHSLKIGDNIYATGPFGFLILDEIENNKLPLIFIAGGIGITPFFSMIKELVGKKNNQEIYLFYSSQKISTIIFFEELNKLSQKYNNLNIKYFLSQEKKNNQENMKYKRLSIDDIKKEVKNFKKNNFFICGSVQYVNHFWKELKRENISEENILTEAFFI